jgi:hypothetical protein
VAHIIFYILGKILAEANAAADRATQQSARAPHCRARAAKIKIHPNQPSVQLSFYHSSINPSTGYCNSPSYSKIVL